MPSVTRTGLLDRLRPYVRMPGEHHWQLLAREQWRAKAQAHTEAAFNALNLKLSAPSHHR